MSDGDRRRTLAGLSGEARRIVGRLLDDFDGWDAAMLHSLKCYGLSCKRLASLQAAPEPGPALYREIRANLALLSALCLERAR